jgi:amino acid permease
MKFELDSVLVGLVIGVCVPILGYGLISFIFDLLTEAGLMDYVSAGGSSKRTRTLWLFALCCNLIPFNILKRKKYDNTMRGIVFPTIIGVGYWLYSYSPMLFS